MIANTCEARVGRLLEIRVDAGYQSVRDVDKMIVMMQAHFGRVPAGEKCIIAADWRNVTMMSPETAIRAREMLARSNPRVIRSAILTLPERSLANLQVLRLVREAELEDRRHFTNAEEKYRWLSEVLTDPERLRLAEFLEIGESSRQTEPYALPISVREETLTIPTSRRAEALSMPVSRRAEAGSMPASRRGENLSMPASPAAPPSPASRRAEPFSIPVSRRPEPKLGSASERAEPNSGPPSRRPAR